MDSIAVYKERLHLQSFSFSLIEHEDATVATVYKITEPNGRDLILKICKRANDYLREVYFLKRLADTLPVPCILQVVQPEANVDGAILMECLPGTLLKITDFTDPLAYEIGSILARIHLNRVEGYGDLIQPYDLSHDPRIHFTLKFEEGFAECSNNLPKALLEQCRRYFDTHIDLLNSVDGPCIAHRDFRPGNVIVNEGKLQGIIDWVSARASFAEEDFCPLEHGEWPTNSTTKRSFLRGYASIRPVPDYSALMPILRLSRAFATIGFMVKIGTWDSIHSRVYQFNRRFLETFLIL
ncbi:MAG TPA: aminoglycoside phosphotransferase family protein [Rhabdochlamydiaceae bacterium]|nr:aminoglycoside phosphotransferase family protein [Rhabdochlamydiaceae bacterium]